MLKVVLLVQNNSTGHLLLCHLLFYIRKALPPAFYGRVLLPFPRFLLESRDCGSIPGTEIGSKLNSLSMEVMVTMTTTYNIQRIVSCLACVHRVTDARGRVCKARQKQQPTATLQDSQEQL